jgi:hypothetical protein
VKLLPIEGRMPQSYARIGWKWDNPERFRFHWDTKDQLRKQLSSGKVDITTLYKMLWVDESWIRVKDGESEPPNFQLFVFIYDGYMKKMKSFRPSFIYRMLTNKVLIVFLTMIREDTAYTSRVCGTIEHIYEQSEAWKNKSNRPRLLRELRDWWEEEDWREYSKVFIRGAFEWIIKKYTTDKFIRASIDHWIDNILVNKDQWDSDPDFDVTHWYPRGTGQMNYLVHGREL